jgi:DNA primase
MIEALKQIDLTEFMSRCWQTRFQKQGKKFVALSPFRKENSPSLYVSREKDGHWVYFDHGSGCGGTLIDAVMEYEGHHDTGQAIRVATRMAEDAGLLSKGSEPSRPSEKQDLEGLFKSLCSQETKGIRDYLIGRRISPELVDRMISSRVVASNRLDGNEYCCFAVRDASGKLRSLYNRKIKGSGKREKFLLGEQYPFCLNWKEVGGATKVYLCEGIIDALSLATLEEGACVVGYPGAHYDPKRHDCPRAKATLIEAFDEDEAGRRAAKRLKEAFPQRAIERFNLKGARDVNELLCLGCGKDRSTGKLSVADRVAVILSDKSSRELEGIYGVDHSRICQIRKEGVAILEEAWAQRRRGRKPKPKPSEEVESMQRELAETKHQAELQAMRIDFLELQIEQEEKRTEEAARKSKARKKKNGEEVKQMLQLIEQHADKYDRHSLAERLKQAELTKSGYQRLRAGHVAQTVRESAIPPEDVAATIEFIVAYPEVGAGKAFLTLLEREAAYLSTANINVVKQELADIVAQAYKDRREAEKALEAQLRRDLADRKPKEYQHRRAMYPNHIWAIDFVNIKFLNMHFVICVVYDEYSQSYRSLAASSTGDHEFACRCVQTALDGTSQMPQYMRRDNGKAFETEEFLRQLGTMEDYPVPPHSPWFNGSLESCNRSLKASVKTFGMQEMIKDPSRFREGRQGSEAALSILSKLLEGARTRLNEEIARKKHETTPAKAYAGQPQAVRERRKAFIAKKCRYRRERMAEIRTTPKEARSSNSLTDKAKSIGKRIIGRLDTSALFVLNEVLHHRFRMFEA